MKKELKLFLYNIGIIISLFLFSVIIAFTIVATLCGDGDKGIFQILF